MASVIVTRTPERAQPGGIFGLWSLTRRVLLVNMLPVLLLGGGMLYLDRYENTLIATELRALETPARIFAAALGEGAVLQDLGDEPELSPSLARLYLRRLTEPTPVRARLFLADRSLIADSRALIGSSGSIQMVELPPPVATTSLWSRLVDWAAALWQRHDPRMEPYVEHADDTAAAYPEAMTALGGGTGVAVRADRLHGGLVLSVAVPVNYYKHVLGAVLVSTGSARLDQQVNMVRTQIGTLFLAGLAITIILSIYLAGTIARPVRHLAEAAHAVRIGQGRQVAIPDYSHRHDEIGELSVALSAMTTALWRRMDATERFAADVAHEIKNPLSSLRSAVETASRITDPTKQRRLMAIIHDDVQRLDRLITDISDASRLDAEMSRLARAPVAVAGLLETLVAVDAATTDQPGPRLTLAAPAEDRLMVDGQEGRLAQVFDNLIGNARSFSPPDGTIRLSAARQDGWIEIAVEDDGPGIPPGKLTAIFDRFYSERPAGEKFGTHSGLGLSISRQIVEAHGGTITAENRLTTDGRVIGARFVVRLPAGGG